MSAYRRLMKEYKQLMETAPEGITAGPTNEDEFLVWDALIEGPEHSCYEGGIFLAGVSSTYDFVVVVTLPL